jgi:hypothetical protein
MNHTMIDVTLADFVTILNPIFRPRSAFHLWVLLKAIIHHTKLRIGNIGIVSDLEVTDTVIMCFQSDFDDPMISKSEHGYHSSFERWIQDIQYYFAFIFHAQDYFLCVSVFI